MHGLRALPAGVHETKRLHVRTMTNPVGDIQNIIFDMVRGELPNAPEISDQTHIVHDLGLDSVAVMDFVMEIEVFRFVVCPTVCSCSAVVGCLRSDKEMELPQ